MDKIPEFTEEQTKRINRAFYEDILLRIKDPDKTDEEKALEFYALISKGHEKGLEVGAQHVKQKLADLEKKGEK